jgi:ankyrin repeat protein
VELDYCVPIDELDRSGKSSYFILLFDVDGCNHYFILDFLDLHKEFSMHPMPHGCMQWFSDNHNTFADIDDCKNNPYQIRSSDRYIVMPYYDKGLFIYDKQNHTSYSHDLGDNVKHIQFFNESKNIMYINHGTSVALYHIESGKKHTIIRDFRGYQADPCVVSVCKDVYGIYVDKGTLYVINLKTFDLVVAQHIHDEREYPLCVYNLSEKKNIIGCASYDKQSHIPIKWSFFNIETYGKNIFKKIKPLKSSCSIKNTHTVSYKKKMSNRRKKVGKRRQELKKPLKEDVVPRDIERKASALEDDVLVRQLVYFISHNMIDEVRKNKREKILCKNYEDLFYDNISVIDVMYDIHGAYSLHLKYLSNNHHGFRYMQSFHDFNMSQYPCLDSKIQRIKMISFFIKRIVSLLMSTLGSHCVDEIAKMDLKINLSPQGSFFDDNKKFFSFINKRAQKMCLSDMFDVYTYLDKILSLSLCHNSLHDIHKNMIRSIQESDVKAMEKYLKKGISLSGYIDTSLSQYSNSQRHKESGDMLDMSGNYIPWHYLVDLPQKGYTSDVYSFMNLWFKDIPGSHITDQHDCSALDVVLSRDNVDCFKILHNNSVLSDPSQDEEDTISCVCKKGSLQILRYITDTQGDNTDIHSVDTDFKTPLHHACEYGHLDIVKLLIKRNAQLFDMDVDFCIPLYYACKNRHSDIVTFLCQNNMFYPSSEDLDDVPFDTHPLHIACCNDSDDMVSQLLDAGYDMCLKPGEKEKLMYAVCKKGLFQSACKMVRKGYSVCYYDTSDKMNCFEVACAHGHYNLVALILSSGYKISDFYSESDRHPLFVALARNDKDMARLLLRAGINVSSTSAKELYNSFTDKKSVSRKVDYDMINMLIMFGCPLDSAGSGEMTCLEYACSFMDGSVWNYIETIKQSYEDVYRNGMYDDSSLRFISEDFCPIIMTRLINDKRCVEGILSEKGFVRYLSYVDVKNIVVSRDYVSYVEKVSKNYYSYAVSQFLQSYYKQLSLFVATGRSYGKSMSQDNKLSKKYIYRYARPSSNRLNLKNVLGLYTQLRASHDKRTFKHNLFKQLHSKDTHLSDVSIVCRDSNSTF